MKSIELKPGQKTFYCGKCKSHLLKIKHQCLSQGTKLDSEKPRTELMSAEALTQYAKVLTYGAKKYADFNWAKGIKYSRVIAAILRHTMLYMSGETIDPETGLSHMSAVMTNASFLIHFEKYRPEFDDRNIEVYSASDKK